MNGKGFLHRRALPCRPVAGRSQAGVAQAAVAVRAAQSLADFAVTYEINVYCDQPQAMGRPYTAPHQHILDVFSEYRVQIMTPPYEGDPEQPKVVPNEQWFMAPAPTPGTDGSG